MWDKIYPMMGIFTVAFILLMLWDIESRMAKRFRRSDLRFNRMSKTLLAIQQDIAHVRLKSEGQKLGKSEALVTVADDVTDAVTLPGQNRISRLIYPTTFDHRNNTNIFWRYTKSEYIYRVLGKVDVTGLRKLVKSIPEEVWQEGAERAKRYKVHQYTATISLRFGADRVRDWKKADNPFEGTLPTYDLLNQYGEMNYKKHWPKYKSELQPILEYIQSKFANKNGIWLRVLLVRLTAGKSVDIHRDNGLWMRMSHRIHVPVFTDEQVQFHASNKPKSFRGNAFTATDVILPVQEPGAVVELNNANIHYVRNSSPHDRVHMICDYMPELPKDMTYEEWRCLLGDAQKCTNMNK